MMRLAAQGCRTSASWAEIAHVRMDASQSSAAEGRRRTMVEQEGIVTTAMKAIINNKYGSPDKLELREIDQPVIDDDSVLVRVRAASVNPADWYPMRGKPYFMRLFTGLRRPKS